MNFITPNPADFFKHELTIKPDEGIKENYIILFQFILLKIIYNTIIRLL